VEGAAGGKSRVRKNRYRRKKKALGKTGQPNKKTGAVERGVGYLPAGKGRAVESKSKGTVTALG